MTNGTLMHVKILQNAPLWSIVQYFWPTLRIDWSWKPIFGLLESGRFTQVLLYCKKMELYSEIMVLFESMLYIHDNNFSVMLGTRNKVLKNLAILLKLMETLSYVKCP